MVLKVAPKHLARLAQASRDTAKPGLKRKAERAPDGAERAYKRQNSAEPLMNGYVEREKRRLVVKLKIGRENAERVEMDDEARRLALGP